MEEESKIEEKTKDSQINRDSDQSKSLKPSDRHESTKDESTKPSDGSGTKTESSGEESINRRMEFLDALHHLNSSSGSYIDSTDNTNSFNISYSRQDSGEQIYSSYSHHNSEQITLSGEKDPDLRSRAPEIKEPKNDESDLDKRFVYKISQDSVSEINTGHLSKTTSAVKPKDREKEAESSETSSSEDDEGFGTPLESSEMMWDLRRVLKSLRGGNQTATVIALSLLQDYDLHSGPTLGYLASEHILDTLCNIIETSDDRCKIGSLQVLCSMTGSSPSIRSQMSTLNVLQHLVDLLSSTNLEMKIWTAQLIGNMTTSGRVRRAFRKSGGISDLVNLLQTDPKASIEGRSGSDQGLIAVQHAAETIAKFSKSPKGRREIRLAGFFSLILQLLGLDHVPIAVPVFEILADCLKEKSWSLSLVHDDYIYYIIKGLRTDNLAMQKFCANCITNLALENPCIIGTVREMGAIERMLELLQDHSSAQRHLKNVVGGMMATNFMGAKPVVVRTRGAKSIEYNLSAKAAEEIKIHKENVAISVSGALWRCCSDAAVVKLIHNQNGIGILLDALSSVHRIANIATRRSEENMQLRMHLAGALAECAKCEFARYAIGAAGAVPQLVELLQSTDERLLVRVAEAVGHLAGNKKNCRDIVDCVFDDPVVPKRKMYLNGSRLLFSLLKKDNPAVKAMAAWASCRVLETADNAEELSRELIGGLELVILLLSQGQEDAVTAEVCNLIGIIALDEENLAVMTDYGVVPNLARNTNTENQVLMAALSFAISRCCLRWPNRAAFGKADCVAPLVNYLKQKNTKVNKTTTVALYELSRFALNAIQIHRLGGVQLLLPLIGDDDEVVQEAAAGCIGNIRRIALANDIHRSNQKPTNKREKNVRIHE